jgi:hypothetical protein
VHVPNVLASVALPPTWLAAVLLLGRAIAQRHELPCASGDAIVKAIGASKSQAYEVAGELAALLPTLVRTPGRPAKEESAPPSSAPADVTRAALAYVMSHPGCVDRGAERQRYSTEFRRFVLGLHITHASLALEVFADGVGVPIGTLKDWLRIPCESHEAPTSQAPHRTSSKRCTSSPSSTPGLVGRAPSSTSADTCSAICACPLVAISCVGSSIHTDAEPRSDAQDAGPTRSRCVARSARISRAHSGWATECRFRSSSMAITSCSISSST